jgi:glucosamine 6-phosphate synthetase-like amidotransferase/phosphosugar isomerase protein
MCAIFGIGFQRGHTICNNEMVRTIVRKLFLESMVRGRTASGLACCSGGEVQVIKKNVPGCDFVNLPEYKKAELAYMTVSPPAGVPETSISKWPPVAMIGHCRLKTKGTELNNVNNHPIVRERVVGVHNGVISNDDMLFTGHEKEFGRNGRVDSEIIFALIEHFSGNAGAIAPAIQKAASVMTGGYACAMTHVNQPYIVWLFRNHSPCSILHYEDVGLVIWASLEHFITEATKGFTLGEPKEISFPREEGVAIDLFQNKFYRFPLVAKEEKGKNANA